MHPDITHQSMLNNTLLNPMIDDRLEHTINAANQIKQERERQAQEFNRLCFEVFNTQDGKALMEVLVYKYIMSNLISIDSNSIADKAIYFTGFKDCIIMFKKNAEQHQKLMRSLANVGIGK